ncbi:DUF2075 domain-containing protein [Actinoallomurus rhizosphaericola]|uniref:DUF2075 domain-containing protein n=1 Tax=Actinoallomurus rhizosphaericola TaxID=2952536 RepID=UPI0020900F08|nr:DUF2075 domain-containing protein [Actinoallomurus rhizosphaericola]MCO5994774.1 DUF2075 domain-containing protein [Actinoallomurus rhizosphaericola]
MLTSGSLAEQSLIDTMATAIRSETGAGVGARERRAWRNSLPILANDLIDAGLGQVEVIVEYPIPHQPRKRADVVLAGVDLYTGGDTFVIVELKQWDDVELLDDDTMVLPDPRYDPVLNPIDQVKGYRDQIAANCAAFEEHTDALQALVYLHNAPRDRVEKLMPRAVGEQVQLFSQTDRGDLATYLRGRFAPESGRAAADRFLRSEIRPNKHLTDRAADILRGRDRFVLLDRQHEAYRKVLHHVDQAFQANTKRVVIITGGAGSGKSAIGITLLAHLHSELGKTAYAAGSRSFTETLRRAVSKKDLTSLFKYFNEFAQPNRKNQLNVIIADEAHRAREKSFDRFRAQWRSSRPQIETIIDSARVPVFLLDEHQVVKPGEVGTVAAIKAYAQRLNVKYEHVKLEDQWRCGGSPEYDMWVRRLLGLGDEDSQWNEDSPPEPWRGDKDFEVMLAPSPQELEDILKAKTKNHGTARIAAGYCWPWNKPNDDKTLPLDVVIDDWRRPWNVKSNAWAGDAPPSAFWATLDGGFDQIGCIYTAQGLEYDWAGVIIGPDLVARNGRLITVREASKDKDLTRRSVTDEQFDRLVRNIYHVLLTRGLSGVVVYAVDAETQRLLADLVTPVT